MILHWKPIATFGTITFLYLYFSIDKFLAGCVYGHFIDFEYILVTSLGLTITAGFIHASIKETLDYRRRRREEFERLAAGEDIPFYDRVTTDEYYQTPKKTPRYWFIYTGISVTIIIGLISYSYYLGAKIHRKDTIPQEAAQNLYEINKC